MNQCGRLRQLHPMKNFSVSLKCLRGGIRFVAGHHETIAHHRRTRHRRLPAPFARAQCSPHTIKAYTGDLDVFAAYIGARDWKAIDHIAIRGFLSHLYDKGLSKTSVARALAAVRSLYRWLAQEGVVEQNPAKLVSTPRLPKKLPRVPTIEEMNFVLDGKMPEVASFPERDRLMFELLYGCGIRNSELVGINLDDISMSNEAILIRGKGKKERYVPFGGSARGALASICRGGNNCWHAEKHDASPKKACRAARQPARRTPYDAQRGPHRQAHRGRQGTVARSASAHSASRLRHAHAGRGSGSARHPGIAGARAAGDDQRYTQLSVKHVMNVYDQTHPRAK
jgi:integrase/recombinase XerC